MKFQRGDARGLFVTKNRPVWLVTGIFFCLFVVISFQRSASVVKPTLLEYEAVHVDDNQPKLQLHDNPPLYPPLNCPAVLEEVQQNRSSSIRDPNQGQIYKRQTDKYPSFLVSLHDKAFDPTRWSIMQWGHYYETALMEAFSMVLNATERIPTQLPRVLDVGGNIGFFSLQAAAHRQVVVDTFEPNMINAFRLCQSLEMNGWRSEYRDGGVTGKDSHSHVNCHPYGVGKEVGTFVFEENDNPGQGQLRTFSAKGKEIPVVSLDAFAESRGWFDSRPNIAILKVDVEGYEVNVMQGARKLLESGSIRNIFMEVSARNPQEIAESTFCLGLIASAGYDVHQYGGFRGPKHTVNWSGRNVTELTELVIHEVTKKKHPQLNMWWKLSPE